MKQPLWELFFFYLPKWKSQKVSDNVDVTITQPPPTTLQPPDPPPPGHIQLCLVMDTN